MKDSLTGRELYEVPNRHHKGLRKLALEGRELGATLDIIPPKLTGGVCVGREELDRMLRDVAPPPAPTTRKAVT